MVLSFGELGIQLHEYNGLSIKEASQAIINVAADAITQAKYGHPATNVETLYDWANAVVDFSRWRIYINAAPLNDWIAINT